MRPSVLLAAIPLVLGCAQQSVVRAPTLPTNEPLQVRLYQPAGGMLSYELSEPAYVAIFAVRRGHGISMIFPRFLSQTEHRGHAGLNHETVRGARWTSVYSGGGAYDRSSLLSHGDAYYVIASKYPLPTEEMLRSPYLLQSLVGADLFRATNLSDAWDALEAILVAGLPADSWSSDVYVNWRDPFLQASSFPLVYRHGCNPARLPYWSTLTYSSWCDANRRSSETPTQIVQTPRRNPPAEPLDRNPAVPLPPEEGVARTSRSGNAASSSARTRSEPTRATGRTSTAARPRSEGAPSRAAGSRSGPPPSRAAESRPSRAPGTKAQPKPAN